MLSRIRSSVFAKSFWGLMGVCLLNISVDTADPNPENVPEDLTINDQESIVEIVIEKILGFENAIEEYDDHDTEDHTKKKIAKVDLIVQVSIERTNSRSASFIKKQRYPHHEAYLEQGYHQLETPPPQV